MKHIESKLQRSCVTYFRYQYPDIAKLLFAVPNGGARNVIEATIMKAEGTQAGVSDMILLIANKSYSSLCIEFKIDKGKQTDLQKSWQDITEKHGNKYVICRSFEEFQREINEYLK